MALVPLLNTVPVPLLVIVIVGVSVLLAVAGLLLVRCYFPLSVLELNNDFQDFIFGGVAVFYAVLLAFVVLTVWEQYQQTQQYVDAEANRLGDLLRNAEGYPNPFRRQIQEQVRDYGLAVIDNWNAMGLNQGDVSARNAFDNLWFTYQSYNPRSFRESDIYAEGLRRLSELREYRRLRLLRNQPEVPGFLWFVLFTGEVVTIGSTYFLGMRNLRAQILITAMLTGMITLSLIVIFLFDHPFQGDLRITANAFQVQVDEAARFLAK